MNKADLSGIIRSPKKPNIMQFLFTLKDEIDCSVMYEAMQRTIKRYPYFAFRIIRTETGFDKIENPLPIIVKDSFSEELVLGSEDVNYHWVAAACEGRRLKLAVHHMIADGRSAMRFYKTLLYCKKEVFTVKKTGSTILRYLIAIVLVGVAGFLVTTGFRFLNAHNAMQKEAKIALEDYLSSGRELPVDEFVSYEARWVIGPFATVTDTKSTNGITATSGVNSYYYLILDEPDGLSLMALESENTQENETLERMSDWLLSVDGYPYEGETLRSRESWRR